MLEGGVGVAILGCWQLWIPFGLERGVQNLASSSTGVEGLLSVRMNEDPANIR